MLEAVEVRAMSWHIFNEVVSTAGNEVASVIGVAGEPLHCGTLDLLGGHGGGSIFAGSWRSV